MLNYSALEIQNRSVLLGSIVHSVSFGEIELIHNGMIVYNKLGAIDRVVDLDKVSIDRGRLSQFRSVVDCTGKLIVAGFVDAHCHAPQYVFSGTGMDLPLLAWLEKYTFPCEARFADVEFAKTAYDKSIRRHLKCGTTFAAYFATIHNSGGKVLVDVINRVGQRAFVGKVSMDRNSPDFYIEETERGCQDAEEFARYVLAMTPVGAAFLTSVDSQTPTTTSALLSQSRNLAVSRVSEHSSGSDRSSSLASLRCDPISSSAGLKRPRSVSTAGDDDDVFFPLPNQSGRSSGSDRNTPALQIPQRLRAISDMALYGFGNEEHLESSVQGDASTSSSDAVVTSLLNKPYTPLVMPCITPRFVPTCTGEMLGSLGRIAALYGLPVQSHMSESVSEIAWVKDLHPDCENYASVYQKYGLLNEHCIMAHCCHSDAVERQLIAKCNTAVVHCASSNFSLESGVLDVHTCVEEGIRVGLGTDVAGGYSPSMLDALRQSIIASKVILFEARGDLASTTITTSAAAAAVKEAAAQVMDDAETTSAASSTEPSSATTAITGELPPPAQLISLSTSMESVPSAASAAVQSDASGSSSEADTTDVSSKTSPPKPVATVTQPAVTVADVNANVKPRKTRTLSYKEAFHLATVGGAEALGMGDVVGNFLPGKQLDCLIVDPAVLNGPFDVFDGEGPSEWFQKFLFLGDDRNIVAVFVNGRQVI